MRDIKFRAWDGKKMQYDVFPTSDNTVGRWIETGGGIELRFCDGGGTKVDIMQFTGLKDKNGKEIYEGDIIKDVSVGGYTKWWDGIVTWHDAGSVGWVAEPLSEHKNRGAWGLNYNYDYEIIGNIHQHPNLLEQDNA